jgi:hypothetical protein
VRYYSLLLLEVNSASLIFILNSSILHEELNSLIKLFILRDDARFLFLQNIYTCILKFDKEVVFQKIGAKILFLTCAVLQMVFF